MVRSKWFSFLTQTKLDFLPLDSEDLCLSLLMSYLSDNGNNGTSRSYPIEIGDEYSSEQRDSMAKFLVSQPVPRLTLKLFLKIRQFPHQIKKHLQDFKSTHCTPLPREFFQQPWEIPSDTDFVFT